MEEIASQKEVVVQTAQELEEAGYDADTYAAALLTEIGYSLRQAVLNDLKGEAWDTVESRRHDDLCHCSQCRAERIIDDKLGSEEEKIVKEAFSNDQRRRLLEAPVTVDD